MPLEDLIFLRTKRGKCKFKVKPYMKLLISILLILFVFPAFSQIIMVEISGIRTDKGVIQLSVYCDEKTFADETPYRIYNFPKTRMKDGKITVTIPGFTTGTYGIAMIDDVNENGKIDSHFFIPSEGFGFSNLRFTKKCKPDFKSFSFNLGCEEKTIRIEAFYF
jgi:uncharacterized protein (DUF2141 family)